MKNLDISKNISYESNDINLKELSFNDNKNRLKIKIPSLNLLTNNFLINDKNEISLKNIVLKNPNISFLDNANKLKIEAKNIDLNSTDFLFDSKKNLKSKNNKFKKSVSSF